MTSIGRTARGAALAAVMAVLIASARQGSVVHADGGGTCNSGAWAWAATYDRSHGGSASGGINLSGYSASACVGLAQTNAIFQAGLACENAGITPGTTSGVGFAVVSWYVEWSDGTQSMMTGPDAPQQYDCADTFS